MTIRFSFALWPSFYYCVAAVQVSRIILLGDSTNMARLTVYNIAICLVVAIGGFTFGFGCATFITSIGQPGFYTYYNLDPTSSCESLQSLRPYPNPAHPRRLLTRMGLKILRTLLMLSTPFSTLELQSVPSGNATSQTGWDARRLWPLPRSSDS